MSSEYLRDKPTEGEDNQINEERLKHYATMQGYLDK